MERIQIKYFDKELPKIQKIEKGSWIDLRSSITVELKKGDWTLIPLGIGMKLPIGYEAWVVPRSSTYKNYGIIMTNHMGIIDGFSLDENGKPIPGTGFCGNNDQWMMSVYALRDTVINKGDRICQFRIQKSQPDIEFEEVEELDAVDRGGIGSSGVK